MPPNTPMNQGLCTAVAELVLHIDDEQLPSLTLKFVRQFVAVDSSMVLFYHRDYKPRLFHENLNHPWRENRVNAYLSASYLVDPFYIAYEDGAKAGLYELHEIAPNGFYESEYYKTYYLHSHVSDEIAYLVPTHDGGCFCISIQRRQGNNSFSKEELKQLHTCSTIICSAITKYWELYSASMTHIEEHRVGSALQQALENFGASILTNRECEVLRLMLRGHSTRSSAEKLKISPGTVKIHREKIYSKLDLSSQSELFHLFIDSVSSIDYQYSGDPLENYLSKQVLRSAPS